MMPRFLLSQLGAAKAVLRNTRTLLLIQRLYKPSYCFFNVHTLHLSWSRLAFWSPVATNEL